MDYSEGMNVEHFCSIRLLHFKNHFFFFVRFPFLQAFNWCKDPYFIKPETTPIYAMVRDFGFLFGLILCSPQRNR